MNIPLEENNSLKHVIEIIYIFAQYLKHTYREEFSYRNVLSGIKACRQKLFLTEEDKCRKIHK